jgi:hypothetical protein
MKSQLPDSTGLESAIHSTLAEVDNQLSSSNFMEDWQHARQLLEQTADQKKYVPPYSSLLTIFRKVVKPAFPLAVISGIVIVSLILLIKPVDLPGSASTERGVPVSDIKIQVDVNHAWTTPTDDLLRIDVRAYETHHVSFVQYDPITMEIIQ